MGLTAETRLSLTPTAPASRYPEGRDRRPRFSRCRTFLGLPAIGPDQFRWPGGAHGLLPHRTGDTARLDDRRCLRRSGSSVSGAAGACQLTGGHGRGPAAGGRPRPDCGVAGLHATECAADVRVRTGVEPSEQPGRGGLADWPEGRGAGGSGAGGVGHGPHPDPRCFSPDAGRPGRRPDSGVPVLLGAAAGPAAGRAARLALAQGP